MPQAAPQKQGEELQDLHACPSAALQIDALPPQPNGSPPLLPPPAGRQQCV